MIGVPQSSLLAPISHVPDNPNGGDLKKAAQQFEAIFIRQMLAAARASDFGGEPLFGGPGLKQFNAMHDDHIAQVASASGAFGFSKLIEAQLASNIGGS